MWHGSLFRQMSTTDHTPNQTGASPVSCYELHPTLHTAIYALLGAGKFYPLEEIPCSRGDLNFPHNFRVPTGEWVSTQFRPDNHTPSSLLAPCPALLWWADALTLLRYMDERALYPRRSKPFISVVGWRSGGVCMRRVRDQSVV